MSWFPTDHESAVMIGEMFDLIDLGRQRKEIIENMVRYHRRIREGGDEVVLRKRLVELEGREMGVIIRAGKILGRKL